MRNAGFVDYIMLLALTAATAYFVSAGIARVSIAFRTGRLHARGVVYDRDKQAFMFWLGIGFWVVLGVLLTVLSALGFVVVFGIAT